VLGNRGLYITSEGWFMNNYAKGADDPSYFPFWDAVQSLGIPVFWEISGCPLPTKENYLKQAQRVQNLAKRFPRTRGVVTHAFPIRLFTEPNGRITIPEETMQLAENTNWTFELLFPIQIGRFYEYPYYETLPVVRYVYERLGAEKLCWGSDMPNVERTCTYRQAMEHIYNHTPYIPASHKDLIFGDNLAHMFGIK
jgi:predicted TIM-barrel fold metal-dependent hydrolase